MEIEASDGQLLVSVPDLRAAWGLRRTAGAPMLPLLRYCGRAGIRTLLRVGNRRPWELSPSPGLIFRLIAPALRQLAG